MGNDFGGFYRGKKIFLTGHTGFKGAWLSFWLTEMGATVGGYALPPATTPCLFDLLRVKKSVKHVIGDVSDRSKLRREMRAFRPDIVFHLAAQALVRASYADPVGTYQTNVMGTVNVLECARLISSVKAIVNVTSDKCYENDGRADGYRETDPLGGYDPYSSSKGCAELVTSAYRRSYFSAAGVGVATARAGNVIGGGDWADDRLIPDCIRSLSRKKTIVLRYPRATRPWQHVLEPLSGYLRLGMKLFKEPSSYSQGWNFGPKDESVLPVEKVVKQVLSFWGGGRYRITPQAPLHEAALLKLDINQVHKKLGWRPVWDVSTALSKTVEWYRAYYQGNENMADFTRGQVRHFMETVVKMAAGEKRGGAWS